MKKNIMDIYVHRYSMITIDLRMFYIWDLMNCCLLVCGYGPMNLQAHAKGLILSISA